MGKSLYVRRMADTLQKRKGNEGVACVTIPIHGPTVTPDAVMSLLDKHIARSPSTIFHLDISTDVSVGYERIPCIMEFVYHVCFLLP